MSKRYTKSNPELRAALLATLNRCHQGAENATTWHELAGKLRIEGHRIDSDHRNLREEARELRLAGELVCPSSSGGVFLAVTPVEVSLWRADRLSRVSAMLADVREVERAAEGKFGPSVQLLFPNPEWAELVE